MSDPTTPPAAKPLQGILMGLLAFAVYATHDAAIKTLGGVYAPFQIIFFVVLFSFPFVTLMLLRSDTKDTLRPHLPLWTGVRTAAVVIGGFCAFYSFSVLPLTQTYAILFATPLMITLLSIPILGEVVRLHRWFAVLLGLAGVMVVLQPGSAVFGLGHLAALVAAFCGALSGVVMRKIGGVERREVLLLYPLLANFALMLCILPFVYVPMPLRDLALVLFVAVLAVVAMSLLIRAYALADAAIVAPMQYSQILWAAFFGWLLFDTVSTATTFIGAGIIIASGAYIVLRETRGKSSNQPVLRTLNRRPEMGGAPRVGLVMDADPVEPARE
ncbi:DMT family transporter [Sulfitobacter albidus]|uniref:DMT family transporter n=1 Tax=Sulfitobacter albidus TaxID=2829501 RepID=A0A975PMG2_9RHOB|nr:DMT family transporter [Sulfitobacter albidus]QUJ76386.1 DMT family transporter [Sulfitobacter albidus]